MDLIPLKYMSSLKAKWSRSWMFPVKLFSKLSYFVTVNFYTKLHWADKMFSKIQEHVFLYARLNLQLRLTVVSVGITVMLETTDTIRFFKRISSYDISHFRTGPGGKAGPIRTTRQKVFPFLFCYVMHFI